ncbi:unnamed protein product [Closterium sp. Naga37s-1]|nr:unnamed protein product [Closterium sp. Naga37s-1]
MYIIYLHITSHNAACMTWQVFGVIEADAESAGEDGKRGEGSEAEGPDAKRVKLEGGAAAVAAFLGLLKMYYLSLSTSHNAACMAWQVFGVIEADAEGPGGEGKKGEGSEAEGPDAKRVKLEGGAAAAGASGNGGSPGGKRKLFVGSNALGYRRDFMEVVPSVSNGLLSDWEGVAAIWEHALKDRLLVDPKEHAVLLAEPSFNPPAAREKTVQLMFETLGSPAVFLARNAVLTSFSCGKATSLVVDSGFSSTTVAAVHDGYVLQKSLRRSPVAGDALTEFLLRSVGRQKVRPRFSFKRVLIRPGQFEATAADMKETVCRVPDAPYDDLSFSNVPTVAYELPDGQVLEVGSDRFKVADALFNPSLLSSIASGDPSSGGWTAEAIADAAKSLGIARMVVDSISKCDVDIRKDLYSSVLLSGGTMAMQQIKERLEKELMAEAPQTAKVKVLASGNVMERKFSPNPKTNNAILQINRVTKDALGIGGIFHGAVEVYGEEWSFGYCERGSGVFSCPPKGNPMYTFRETIEMGVTGMGEKKVGELLRRLSKEWPGRSYDMLARNCNHFCDEFCQALGVGPTPVWVNRFAYAGDVTLELYDQASTQLSQFRDSMTQLSTSTYSYLFGPPQAPPLTASASFPAVSSAAMNGETRVPVSKSMGAMREPKEGDGSPLLAADGNREGNRASLPVFATVDASSRGQS